MLDGDRAGGWHVMAMHGPGDSAGDNLAAALERLSDALGVMPAKVRRDARWRASALRWNLIGAPDVAFDVALSAAEQLANAGSQPWPMDASKMGAHLTQEFLAMEDAGQASRFVLESGVRYLHSSGDLMAQVVRTSLLPCSSEGCTLAAMLNPERRCTCLIGEQEYVRLTAALAKYRNSASFRYVTAASNRLKHRNLIPSRIAARRDPDSGDVMVGQLLSGFTHNAKRVRGANLTELSRKTDRLRLSACCVVDEVSQILTDATTPLHRR